jgi:hypothetical protein
VLTVPDFFKKATEEHLYEEVVDHHQVRDPGGLVVSLHCELIQPCHQITPHEELELVPSDRIFNHVHLSLCVSQLHYNSH